MTFLPVSNSATSTLPRVEERWATSQISQGLRKLRPQDSWQRSGCLLMESAARPLCSCTSPSLPEPLLPPAARGLSPHSMQLASRCSASCPAQSDGSVNRPNSDSTGRCQKALSKCPPFKALALNNLHVRVCGTAKSLGHQWLNLEPETFWMLTGQAEEMMQRLSPRHLCAPVPGTCF